MSKFKVGDRVYSILHGAGTVIEDGGGLVKVKADAGDNCRFDEDGRRYQHHVNPTLLTLGEARAKGYDVPKQKIKRTKTAWVNVHSTGGDWLYETKEMADKCAWANRIACVPVTYEYEVEE